MSERPTQMEQARDRILQELALLDAPTRMAVITNAMALTIVVSLPEKARPGAALLAMQQVFEFLGATVSIDEVTMEMEEGS